MTLSPVLIVCAKAPPSVVTVPAVRDTIWWYCSWCGARVKVVA